MFVALFTEAGAARKDEDRFAVPQRGEDRSHASVGDHHIGLEEASLKLRRLEHLAVGDVSRSQRGASDLREYVRASGFTGPAIDGPDQAIERTVRANCDKDHGRGELNG